MKVLVNKANGKYGRINISFDHPELWDSDIPEIFDKPSSKFWNGLIGLENYSWYTIKEIVLEDE